MFAVGKGTILDNGMELQRTIMNLVPSNACFRQLEGATKDLPSICQYLSLVLGDQEQLSINPTCPVRSIYLRSQLHGHVCSLSIFVFAGRPLGSKEGYGTGRPVPSSQ